MAFRYRKKVEAQLLTGTYQNVSKKTWAEYRQQYETAVLAGEAVRYREMTTRALDNFERIIKPVKMTAITEVALAEFVATRRTEPGLEPKSKISPATVNKDLRHLRAAIRTAYRWGYLARPPEFSDCFIREPEKLPTYVTPEDFANLYQAVNGARLPRNIPSPASDWWRALLMTAYMTGWRIGSLLALRRADVDLNSGTAITQAEDNKGKRDQVIDLHPIVIEHLKAIPSFDTRVFPWDHGRRMLFTEFARIQAAAKIKPARKDRYGFHDLRRGFATMNADRLTPDALQVLMQHRDYQTTQRYINIARQLKPAAHDLFVPPVSIPVAKSS